MLEYNLDIRSDQKRQLARLLKEQKKRLGMTDLHFFCKHILNYSDLTEPDGFHGKYCKHITDEDYNFYLSLTPRGTLKSSVGTIGLGLQKIVNNGNTRGLIASEKFTNSTKFLAEMKGHIEHNDTFKDLYGNLKGNVKWTESEIIVSTRTNWKKEPTISCAGIDVTKVGMHYDWIIVDDPHSDQNTQNQDQIDKVIRWYRLLLSLLDPGGKIYVTGTIWHFNDLYSYIQNKERERVEAGRKPRFKVFKRDSFKGTLEDLLEDRVPPEKLLWKERLTADYLRDQLLEQGPYIFSCQYRLNPVDDETAIFKRSWIKTCDYSEVPKNLRYFSTIDPMLDEEGRDFLAIVTCGVDKDWRAYLMGVTRLKADEHETVDKIFDVYNKFHPEKMGMETVAWQQSYYKYVKMLQIMRGQTLPMTQLKTSTRVTKRLRIKGMVPYWKAGLFIIPCPNGELDRVTGNMAILVDELTRYPKTANDDTIDALAYMNQLMKRPGVISILKKINPKSFHAVRTKLLGSQKKKKLGKYNVRKHYART